MGKKKLVPKRRFRGFEGNWVEFELGEKVDFFSGLTYSPRNVVTNDGVFVLRSSNIKNSQIVDADNVYVDKSIVNSEQVRIGDIIVVVRNGSRHLIGKNAVVKKELSDTVIGAFMTGLRSEHYNFNHALLNTKMFEKQVAENLGATINQITTGVFSKMKFKFPGDKEQQKTGHFFKLLDERIANQERKIAKVKALKSAYLTEMFPQEGETVPKRRFKGFEGEWKNKSLGELSTINTGDSDVKDAVPDGKYPFFVRSKNIERSDIYTFEGEAILIPGEGNLGEIYHYFNGKFNYHQRVYKISNFKDGIDGQFIYYMMNKTFKKHAMRQTVKATVDSLRLPTLIDYKLELPCIKEQQKIGQFFKNLDYQIATEERKLEKLKSMKEAYLEEMFV